MKKKAHAPVSRTVSRKPQPQRPSVRKDTPSRPPARSTNVRRALPLAPVRKVKPVLPKAPAQDDHAKRSPSSLKNREQCPGFEPRKGDSVFSAEGHHLHFRMEMWAAEQRGLPLPKWKDKEPMPDLTVEQEGLLEKLQGYVSQLLHGFDQDGVHLERKLDLRPLGLPGCDFGTADFIGIRQGVATLIDYKFGKVEVDDPEENVQFHAYALAIFLTFPQVDCISVVALQPRLDCVSTATFMRADIPALTLRLKVIIERCEAMAVPFAQVMDGVVSIHEEFVLSQLNPQTSLCEYCAHIGTCPAVAAFALKLVPGPKLPEVLNPHKLTKDENGLGQLFAWAKLCEEKGKSLQKEIGRVAQSGADVAGYHLVNGSTPSTLLDPVGLCQTLIKKHGFTEEQVFSCVQVSMEKVESIVAATAPKGKKEAYALEINKKVKSGGFYKPGFGYSYLKKN